ncbi:MAG TPA: hypothetical protein VHN14_26950 [Kofleriaceae bacterium]|nr:hypothetical protein [Kofleriaceae bacterium]
MNRAVGLAAGAVLAVLGACTGDLDPPWQLDHDRIIAVRATPPGIAAGGTSAIDALLGMKGGKTHVAPPELARVVSPASLSDVLSFQAGAWVVTAPGEARLAAARAELKLAADAPVPVQVGVSYAGQTLFATKTIELGRPADNPALVNVMLDGVPAGPSEIIVGKLVKVPLSIDADDTDFDVTWLTSCGTMHDFDLPNAYLEIEADDPEAGELAVVLRDARAGVAWNVWSIRAE